MAFCVSTVSPRVTATYPRNLRCNASSASVSPPAVDSGSSQVYDSVIVGAGISGLVTGLALQTKHDDAVPSVLITEARERVGGNITSRKNDDYIWEEGPNSFQPSDSVLEAAVRRTVEGIWSSPTTSYLPWDGRSTPSDAMIHSSASLSHLSARNRRLSLTLAYYAHVDAAGRGPRQLLNTHLYEQATCSHVPTRSCKHSAHMQVDTGVEKELVLGDPTAPRFVYWKNKLRATPSGPVSAVFGDFLSFPGKIRAGLGAVGLFKAPPPGKEESVKEFISRNLGEEVFYRLIEPFCSGVYAGDPTKLSMKAAFGKIQVLEEKAGSLVGGGLKLAEERKANPGPPRPAKLPPKPAGQTVGSFKEGLQTLPEAIAKELDDKIRCDWKLTAVSKNADGIYELEYSTPEGAQTVQTRSVALTAPSYVVADLLGDQVPALAEALGGIDYPPVCAVTLAYPEASVKVWRIVLSRLLLHLPSPLSMFM